METCINIGGHISKETAENLASCITTIFKAGKDNGMDQTTIVEALRLLQRVASADGATVSNSTIIGEQHSHAFENSKEED